MNDVKLSDALSLETFNRIIKEIERKHAKLHDAESSDDKHDFSLLLQEISGHLAALAGEANALVTDAALINKAHYAKRAQQELNKINNHQKDPFDDTALRLLKTGTKIKN